MITALKTFLSDLLSAIVFLVVFAVTGNTPLAIAISIAAGVGQIALEKLRGRPVSTMQWASMGLVVVFGGVSLLTHDNRFIMIKPTIINFAIGAVMLQRGWLDRYLPPIAHENLPRSVIVGSGYAWAFLLFAVGVANFVVAITCSVKIWVWYNATVPLALELTAFGVQYLVFRVIVIRKRRRVAALQSA